MQAILLFSNDKSKQLFRSDMYSFPSLFNVFLCFFLFLSLLRFTFSFLLRSLLHSLSSLSIFFFFFRISISIFFFIFSRPLPPYSSSLSPRTSSISRPSIPISPLE